MMRTSRYVARDGAIVGARLVRPGPVTSGRSALLFVHGVGSTAAIWDSQLEAFGDEWSCVAIELRGNGALRPDPDPTLITRAGFADDVMTVADELSIERFTLVGCSLGGVVALELWKLAPQRLRAMVMLGSFARYPDGQRYADGVAAEVREAGTMRAFAERRAAKLALPAARLRETIEQMACKSVPCYLASTQATWTGDYRALLSTIDVPVLVAYGERDVIAPRALSAEIASGIAGAKLAMVGGAGHVANADDPPAFNRLLREFLG